MTTVPTDSADFISQVVAWLAQNRSITVALSTTDGQPSLFGDEAQGSPDLPYLVLTETSEKAQWQGPDATGTAIHFDRGTLNVYCFAAGKAQARALGRLVTGQLNDAPIQPDDGLLLEIRQSDSSFIPIPSIAPGSSTVACRLVTFLYVIQRAG